MRVIAGTRCDACGILELRDPLTKDHRPSFNSRDRFFQFIIPPADTHPLDSKRPHPNKFKGIASASEPKKLAELHSCPSCVPKIRKSMAKKDPSLLPPGPLRAIMEQIKSKYGSSSLRIH